MWPFTRIVATTSCRPPPTRRSSSGAGWAPTSSSPSPAPTVACSTSPARCRAPAGPSGHARRVLTSGPVRQLSTTSPSRSTWTPSPRSHSTARSTVPPSPSSSQMIHPQLLAHVGPPDVGHDVQLFDHAGDDRLAHQLLGKGQLDPDPDHRRASRPSAAGLPSVKRVVEVARAEPVEVEGDVAVAGARARRRSTCPAPATTAARSSGGTSMRAVSP